MNEQWFWEQCGLKIGNDQGQLYIDDGQGFPNIRKDLNHLFKYAVPEGWQQIIFQPDHYCGLTVNDELFEATGDTEAGALFGAVYKYLEGK